MTTTVAERPHGYAKYRLEGCRCNVCGFAVSRYEEGRQAAIRDGTWQPYVDAEPARLRLRELMAAGIGRRRVAELLECSDTTLCSLLFGKPGRKPTRRVRPELAEKILALAPTLDTFAAGARVDATGAKRRIQALACLGWTLTAQAQRVGWSVQNFAPLLDADMVVRATADKVRALYDELSMQPAPKGYGCTRIRNLAAAQGWFPPLAWDDDTIDDPAAPPALVPPIDGSDPGVDEWAIQRVAAGYAAAAGLDTPARRELARRLAHDGWTQRRIGDLMGVSDKRVGQLLAAPSTTDTTLLIGQTA